MPFHSDIAANWGRELFWFTLYSGSGPSGVPGARCLRAQKVTFEELFPRIIGSFPNICILYSQLIRFL